MGGEVATQECSCWYGIEIVVLGWIARTTEHVQHALSDEEASKYVDGGDESSDGCQGSWSGRR